MTKTTALTNMIPALWFSTIVGLLTVIDAGECCDEHATAAF